MNAQRLLKLLIPTASQLVVCLILSIAIQALIFQSVLIPHLFKPSPLTPYLNSGRQLELAHLNSFSAVRLAVQGIFWAIVGLCAYIVYLGLINAIVEARNEVVVSRQFANKGKGKGIRAFKWQIGLLAILVLVFVLTAKFGLDKWFSLTSELVIGGLSTSHVAATLISIFGFAVNLYIIWVLAEATITADR